MLKERRQSRQRETWADVIDRLEKLVQSMPDGHPDRAHYLKRIEECRVEMQGRNKQGKFISVSQRETRDTAGGEWVSVASKGNSPRGKGTRSPLSNK